MKTYNKVTGIFYADAPYLPRVLKVIGTIAYILIMLCLTGAFSLYVKQIIIINSNIGVN
jgi:hypothetical protein